jgi:hypothetical protein
MAPSQIITTAKAACPALAMRIARPVALLETVIEQVLVSEPHAAAPPRCQPRAWYI